MSFTCLLYNFRIRIDFKRLILTNLVAMNTDTTLKPIRRRRHAAFTLARNCSSEMFPDRYISIYNIIKFNMGFHSSIKSSIKLTINSPTIASASTFADIVFGYTTNNKHYISTWIPMDNRQKMEYIQTAIVHQFQLNH